MIDYILKWTNLATAKADVVATANMVADLSDWLRDHCVEVQLWRNSQDTTSVDAQGNTIIVHTFLSGFYILVSVGRRFAVIENDPACQLGIDRDKMNSGLTGFIVYKNAAITVPLLADIRFQPVFMGMNVPWGGLN